MTQQPQITRRVARAFELGNHPGVLQYALCSDATVGVLTKLDHWRFLPLPQVLADQRMLPVQGSGSHSALPQPANGVASVRRSGTVQRL